MQNTVVKTMTLDMAMPPLNVTAHRPSDARVRQLVEEHPGLGELQAYRMLQQQMAIQASFRSAEGRRYWAMREARRHEGC